METLLKELFSDEKFVELIEDHLRFAPELKLENNFTTLISIFLNKKGVPSRREEKKGNRKRCDLLIKNKIVIEAKYHLDCDLIFAHWYFKNKLIKENRNIEEEKGIKNWRGVGIELLSDLTGKNDYFLWFLCVRNPLYRKEYKYQSMTNNFYKWTECNYETSDVVIQKLMPEINELFHHYREFDFYQLPLISTEKATLWTFLYKLNDRKDAA